MAQILIFGASTVYGVGGSNGGWSDILKRNLHQQMYSQKTGEQHEVYVFAKPSVTVEFVAATSRQQIKDYQREDRPIIAILSVGMNNAKAVTTPDNFADTPDTYRQNMSALLRGMKERVDSVICVGFTPVDEEKTNPKISLLQAEKATSQILDYHYLMMPSWQLVTTRVCRSLISHALFGRTGLKHVYMMTACIRMITVMRRSPRMFGRFYKIYSTSYRESQIFSKDNPLTAVKSYQSILTNSPSPSGQAVRDLPTR